MQTQQCEGCIQLLLRDSETQKPFVNAFFVVRSVQLILLLAAAGQRH